MRRKYYKREGREYHERMSIQKNDYEEAENNKLCKKLLEFFRTDPLDWNINKSTGRINILNQSRKTKMM